MCSSDLLRHFWDGSQIFGPLLSQTLQLVEPVAWDVYLIYLPHHSWNTRLPPMPSFWMHQLDEEAGLALDPPCLKASVKSALERFSQ